MRLLWSAGRQLIAVCAVVVALAGCASLAVTRCDTIEDRDGKYFGRFFLGVATLGLSEVTIQQEEVRQAYEGSPSCPPPQGVKVVTAPKPTSTGAPSAAVGTLVNGTRWTIGLYLNQDPVPPAWPPSPSCARTAASRSPSAPASIACWPARPAPRPGRCPAVQWSRQFEIDPRVRGFKLQFQEADFK